MIPKCAVIGYVPPPQKNGAAIFYENINQFETTYPLRIYSDHNEYNLRRIANPAPYRNPKKPFVISNLIFLSGLADAIDAKLDYILYIEDDCRFMGDGWDGKMFDDFFRVPDAIFGGSPVVYHPMSAGRTALKCVQEFAWSYFHWTGYLMPVVGDAGGLCFWPNGALAIYHVPTIAQHFNGFQKNPAQWALQHEAWDMHIGRSLTAQYGTSILERFAPVTSAYSGYGNKMFSEDERKEMLVSGKVFAVHQIKDGRWTPSPGAPQKVSAPDPVKEPTPVLVPSVLRQTPWKCGFFDFPKQENTFYYNPSMAVTDKGEIFLVARREVFESWNPIRRQNSLSVWSMDENKALQTHCEIQFPTGSGDHNYEDPRLIYDGAFWLSYYHYLREREIAHQEIARLGRDFTVEHVYHPVYGKNIPTMATQTWHEKNWVWFQHEGIMRCVYLVSPKHVVFTYDGIVVSQPQISEVKHAWDKGQPRAGTPPLRVGDEYFSFFHSSLPWDSHPNQNRYFMGAYAFKAEPPFAVTRMTTEPLLTGSESDPMRRWSPPCVFPGGAVLDVYNWFVVLGVNDCSCAWISIPHEDLLKRMETLC